MKQRGPIIVTIILVIIAIIAFISYSYYQSIKPTYTVLSDDMETIAMYVDGNKVASMNAIPEGYIIDETSSYCYTSDVNTHDGNAILYTNSNGEHVIGNLVSNEKCVVYFVEGVQLIDFSFGFSGFSGEYETVVLTAESGMTFEDWANSEYNTVHLNISPGGCLYLSREISGMCMSFSSCYAADINKTTEIIENSIYTIPIEGPSADC